MKAKEKTTRKKRAPAKKATAKKEAASVVVPPQPPVPDPVQGAPSKVDKVFTIDFKSVNEIIDLMTTYKFGFFDPKEQVYVLDGVAMESKFLDETISKFSHYINSISNMRSRMPVGSKEMFDTAQRTTQEPIPVLDDNGNPITYEWRIRWNSR